MYKFGVKCAAVGLVVGLSSVSGSAFADGGESAFIDEILNAPSIYPGYGREYEYDRPPVDRRAPTNIATVRARALPPKPFVALRQAKLKPAENMGTYSTAVYEQLIAPSGDALRVRSTHSKEIIKFYIERNFKPVWLGDYGMAIKTRRILALMSKADEEGLRAQNYLPVSLSGFSDRARGIADTPTALAKLEIEITAAALEYSHHVSAGRVKPLRISKLHTLKAAPVAPADVLANIGLTLHPETYLGSLQPMIPQYQHLKKALAKYRNKADVEEAIYIPAGGLIRAGGYDDRLELIAKRLHQLGFYDYKPDENSEADNSETDNSSETESSPETGVTTGRSEHMIYNAELVTAVKDMQEQSGLRRDGIIGRNTLNAMNGQTGAEKVAKIILSMERLRWLPQDLKRKYVFVNQAFFETWMMEDGKEIFRSDVIVGKPLHQTAVFSDEMEKVVLNPRWYVPRSIIYNEMMPKLYDNPYYLEDQGYEVMDVQGRRVDSASIDWSQFGEKSIPFNVRQPSGPRNALGRVKFLFPNKHAIYMHDTPSRSLFKKSVRSLSHGCVRVQKPMEFAEIVLKTEGWTPSQISDAIASGVNQTVELSTKIPVYLGYFTAWADANGDVRIKDDIYNRDRVLKQALEQNDQARAPRKYALND